MKLVFIALLFGFAAEAKEIALTFDDSPRVAMGYFNGPKRAAKLIENLKISGVTETAFFSVSSNLDQEGKERLEAYSRAGHIIANHTHSHQDFNQTSAQSYLDDFIKADALLSKFSTFKKWFRFPYLREGNDAIKRDLIRKSLLETGYINSYITINNYDWYMEDQFQKEIKKNPKLDFKKLRNYYVGNLIEAVKYYDEMAIKHLGRSPKHIILLHETDLNAIFINDFVSALTALGWKIISPDEAYKDDISKYSTNSVFKINPGRIGEIARDKGQKDGLWHKSCDENYLDQEFQKQVLQ